MLQFALRGSEVKIQMEKSDAKLEKDGKGEEYIVLSTDFMPKVCWGGLHDRRSFDACLRMQQERLVSEMQLLLEKLHPEVEHYLREPSLELNCRKNQFGLPRCTGLGK